MTSKGWNDTSTPHTFAVMEDGIYAAGENTLGCLGLNVIDKDRTEGFTEISFDNAKIKRIKAIGNSCFIITNENELYAVGYNRQGELGVSYEGYVSEYTKIFENVKDVWASEISTMILTLDNKLYYAGDNDYQFIATGSDDPVLTFMPIDMTGLENKDFNTLKKVAMGYGTSYILFEDGDVFGIGRYGTGQFSLGTVDKSARTSTFIKISIPGKKIIDIEAGNVHLYALTEDKGLYVTGYNYYGQLGIGNRTDVYTFQLVRSNVRAIGCSGAAGHYIGEDGFLYGAGWGYHACLGNGYQDGAHINYKKVNNLSNLTNFYCTADMNIIVQDANGKLYAGGFNSYNMLSIPNSNGPVRNYTEVTSYLPCAVEDIEELYMGLYITSITTKDNKYYVCGTNLFGIVGFLYSNYRSFTKLPRKDIKQIEIGNENYGVFMLTNNNDLYSVGYDYDGELGFGEMHGARTTWQKILSNVDRFISCYGNTFMFTKDNKLFACGGNYAKELLDTDVKAYVSPIEITGLPFAIEDIETVYSEDQTIIYLLRNGDLYGKGWNGYGQLGIGTRNNSGDPTPMTFIDSNVKKFILHNGAFIYIKNSGEIIVSGSNDHYQLGVPSDTAYVDQNGVSHMDFVTNRVQLTLPTGIKEISCHDDRTFLIDNNNDLYVCGESKLGQLGIGNYEGYNEITKSFENVEKIYHGKNFTFLKTLSGEYYTAGDNSMGQLGLGHRDSVNTWTKVNMPTDVEQIILGPAQTFIINKDGKAWCAGSNVYGHLGLQIPLCNEEMFTTFTPYEHAKLNLNSNGPVKITVNNELVKVEAGASNNNSTILSAQEYIYVKGNNEFGQLGTGDNEERTEFTKISFNNCKEVSCGDNHSTLLNKDGEIFAAGKNDKGQLGISDFKDRNVFTKNEIMNNVNHIKVIGDMTIVETQDNKMHKTNPETGNFDLD
jgi:alpha-tubulin suppressor-like RCC1 family protein